MSQIQYVSNDESRRIIEDREPLGLFFLKDGEVYIGIDNSYGDAFVEEFDSLEACQKWLIQY